MLFVALNAIFGAVMGSFLNVVAEERFRSAVVGLNAHGAMPVRGSLCVGTRAHSFFSVAEGTVQRVQCFLGVGAIFLWNS